MTEKFVWPKNFVNLKNFKIFKTGSFWHQIWKNRQKLSQKKLFWCWWRHRWRHSETLNIALYIHVYFIPCIFQLWCNISETNAMLYHMALSIGYIKNFSLRIYLQNWLRYRHSKFQCCLLNSAINFLARITKLNTIGDQHIGYVSWKFQRNRFSSCWHVNTLNLCACASSQKSFSRPNEATVELPGCFKMFLLPLGTFSNWFDSENRFLFSDFASNCPYPVAKFSRQSNSRVYWTNLLLGHFLRDLDRR